MRRTRKIEIKLVRNIKVTHAGEVLCRYCGRPNRLTVGLVNPICWHCRKPLA